jgi:hypothetical protein
MKPVVNSGASFHSAKNKLGELDRSFRNLATMEAGEAGRWGDLEFQAHALFKKKLLPPIQIKLYLV